MTRTDAERILADPKESSTAKSIALIFMEGYNEGFVDAIEKVKEI